jgi:predicted nucleic-acid-binding Zn-ribbon protein
MRESMSCPKCRSQRIWRIEKFHGYDNGSPKPLSVLLAREMPQQQASGWFDIVRSELRTIGRFDLYLCARCGYSELYAQDFKALVHSPEHGVHLMDADVPAGPYR